MCLCMCIYIYIYIHPSIHPPMVLQSLLGPGLLQMSPFFSVFCSWCVCVYIYVNNFQVWLSEVMKSYCLSLYKVCHIIIIPYIQYHMQWSWNKNKLSILQFSNINKKPNHDMCVCMHVFCVCVHTYIHSVSKYTFASTYSVILPVCTLHDKALHVCIYSTLHIIII